MNWGVNRYAFINFAVGNDIPNRHKKSGAGG